MTAKIVVAVLLMFAGGVLTSLAEYKFKYNLYQLIATKIFRKKLPIAIVLLLLMGFGIRNYYFARGTGALAYATVEPKEACDKSLWNHVYHPDRLKVISPCITLTGTVVDATNGRRKDGQRHEADGDNHGWLELDPGQTSNLIPGNGEAEKGNMVFECVCEYVISQKDAMEACENYHSKVKIPPVGSHVAITGSLVEDLQHKPVHREIHPVSDILVLPVKR